MQSLMDILDARGLISFADFMDAALYTPGLGYYAREGRLRVAAARGADFYTAESMGGVFASLVTAAAWELAAEWRDKDMAFVELGSEPGAPNVASAASPPFAEALCPARGQPLPEKRPLLLFSNELFDAQPFHRLVRSGGQWRECGVRVRDDHCVEELLEGYSDEVLPILPRLPAEAAEGCRVDLPLRAEALMAKLAAPDNVKCVIAFDYGLDWDDILYRRPQGTARAYRSHQLCGNLLDAPGEQDLTCHICWDGLERVLREAGFAHIRLLRQEAFFMRHAAAAIEALAKRADIVEMGRLRELLHPSRMGAAFQVLVARRA